MEPTQTALIVPIPDAEPAVGSFRASLDRAASWGVPAHVTVLYPFLSPERIDEAVLATVRDIVAAVPRSEVWLSHVDWFGDTVVWLAPQPDHLFRDLTAAVWRPLSGGTTVRRRALGSGAALDDRSRRCTAGAGERR